MATEILVIILLLAANGVFAMSEIALVSARRPRLAERAEAGDAAAARALKLTGEPDRFLATVQVGITLVGTLAGAFGGARLAAPLAETLRADARLAPYAEPLALGAVVLAIAYLALIVGELVPKRIGLAHPERIAAAVAGPMEVVARAGAPLVWILTASTRGVLALLRIRPPAEPPVTEAELALLLEQGTRAGVFHLREQEMVERVFRMEDQRVEALMTPRRRIVWLDADCPAADLRAEMARHRFTRYVVCDGDLDRPLGVAEVRDLWAAELSGERVEALRPHLRAPLYIPPSTRALQLLERFRDTGVHVALVVDEYGGTAGMVTLNDLVEGLAGDLPEAGDPEGPSLVRREDGSWLVDGTLPLAELLEHVALMPEPEAREFNTVAGFVFTRMGHVPRAGEHFAVGGYRVEVVDMDGNRIDKVLVAPLPSG